jgi:hypothetical protein
MYYNHHQWPSPRAVRFVRELAKLGYVMKPAGRLTHDKALGILADQVGMTVPVFLRDITPIGLLNRIGARPVSLLSKPSMYLSYIIPLTTTYSSGTPISPPAPPPAPVLSVRTLRTALVELTGSEMRVDALLATYKGITL